MDEPIFSMRAQDTPWCKNHIQAHASLPVVRLLEEFSLFNQIRFPNADCLNALTHQFYPDWQGPLFVAQGKLDKHEQRYYEEIIAQDNRVPTRENSWHDLFNALIWLQFPNTKALLNQLHIQDIKECGVHPRTPRRNRITHFDECGIVLAIESGNEVLSNTLLSQLAHHQWTQCFCEHKSHWWKHITPFVFGHANLEMMLCPFIGLTGKWLAVSVPKGFHTLDFWSQRKILDNALVERIHALGDFSLSPLLKPFPILGVPSWYSDQNKTFYSNSDYFRPLRAGAKDTIQLPFYEYTEKH